MAARQHWCTIKLYSTSRSRRRKPVFTTKLVDDSLEDLEHVLPLSTTSFLSFLFSVSPHCRTVFTRSRSLVGVPRKHQLPTRVLSCDDPAHVLHRLIPSSGRPSVICSLRRPSIVAQRFRAAVNAISTNISSLTGKVKDREEPYEADMRNWWVWA